MSFRICSGDPGPGFWRRDTAHFPTGVSRHLWELQMLPYDAAVRRSFARYGSSIDHIDIARIHGRIYMKLVPVENEAELVRRRETADQAIQRKLWRVDREAWPKIRDQFHDRLIALARKNPENMSQPALLDHLAELRSVFQDGSRTHFELQPASTIPVGDWLRLTCEKTGIDTSNIAPFLRTLAQPADFLRTLDLLVEQIRSSPGSLNSLLDQSRNASETLQLLRWSSSELAQSFQTYMDEYADRLVTGFDVMDATLRELPEALLAVIRSRVNFTRGKPTKRKTEESIAFLREKIPPDHMLQFEEGLEEATTAYGLHDEDVRITYLWPLGLIRRAMLTAGATLLSSGAISELDHIFQTTPAELDALIGGSKIPSTDELERRHDEWKSWSQMELPLTFGAREDKSGSLYTHRLSNRIDLAIAFYMNLMESRHDAVAKPEWIIVDGIAASPGRYEGPARVIHEPSDFGRLKQGDVLVSRNTSPAYNLVMPLIGAVVTDRGGSLCHSAIVAREYGIPAVVGTEEATILIPDGARVLVDGDRGFVAVRS